MLDFTGKTALVTGASRGLGQAVAVALGSAGAKVVALARTKGGLEQTDDLIRQAGGQAPTLMQVDLHELPPLAHISNALLDRFGGLDILVGAAGYLGQLMPVGQSDFKVVERAMTINYAANMMLIQSLDSLLRQSQHGRAVFATCRAGVEAKPFWGSYGASKAALNMAVQCYAEEIKGSQVKVNLYDPGPLPTELRKAAMPGEDRSLLPPLEPVAKDLLHLCHASCETNGMLHHYGEAGTGHGGL